MTGITGLLTFAKLTGAAKRTGGFLKSVPTKVWIALAIVLALFIFVKWHGNRIERSHAEQYAAGHKAAVDEYKAKADRIRTAAEALKNKAEASQSVITQEVQSAHAQKLDAIRARADALRMRGPATSAAYPRQHGGAVSSLPAASGGTDAAAQGRLIGVDWNTLVSKATACEIDATTLGSLQTWVRAQKKLSDDHQAELARVSE